MRHLLSAIIGIPALGALVLAALPARLSALARGIALAASSLALILSIALWMQFEPRGVEWQFLEEYRWRSGVGIGYVVGADGFGALVLVLTTVTVWSALLLADAIDDRARAQYASTLMFEAGVLGAIASLNLACFALFWIATIVSAGYLVRVWTSGGVSPVAARFIRYVSLATVAVFAGIVVLVLNGPHVTGSYTLDIRIFQHVTLPAISQRVIFAAFLVGFGLTSGAFPFHVARRDVIAEAPAAVWIPIGLALSTVGTFALMRLTLPIVPDAVRVTAPGVAVVSAIGAVYAVVAAIRQRAFTRFLADASVVLVGVVWMSSTVLTPAGLTSTVVQHVIHSVVMLMLALTITSRVTSRWATASVGVALVLVAGLAIYPAPVLPRIETSVARVILRVSPQHAAEVADCLTASQSPLPPPDIPGLPAGASMAAPCDTAAGSEHKP